MTKKFTNEVLPMPPVALKKSAIDNLTFDLKRLPSQFRSWSARQVACFLAGVQAGIDYAKQLIDELGITMKLRAEWARWQAVHDELRKIWSPSSA